MRRGRHRVRRRRIRGAERTSNLAVATFDKSSRRPFREETTAGIDRRGRPGRPRERDVHRIGGSATSRARSTRARISGRTSSRPDRPAPTGTRRRAGTADHAPITVYNQNAGIIQSQKTVNDDRLATRSKALELTAERRRPPDGGNVLAGDNPRIHHAGAGQPEQSQQRVR